MVLSRRYCIEYSNGDFVCGYRDGFWYTDKGIIIKWVILASIFLFFTLYFIGGYMHARRRLRTGKPLLSYHRWLVPYNERRRYGQAQQNHFTFYATQPGYYPNQYPYGPRPNGTYPEPPPMYGGDAPPGYNAPAGASKMHPNQNGNGMDMPQYGFPPPAPPPTYMGGQTTGVVGGSAQDVEQGQAQAQTQESAALPPRPQNAKVVVKNLVSRFRR